MSRLSRRHFFFGSLLAGAIPRGGFGSSASLKALGYKSPNEKLNIAGIGAGGQGAWDLNNCATENIVALCDVDSRRAADSFSRYEKAAKYTDFRRMLDKEGRNVDAVTIAIPDHMHATVALACMQHGKHVYLEKPLTRTPWEARLLTAAAAKYKVATQMGNQGYSHEGQRVACEIIWSGEIGNVTEVHATTTAPSWPQGLQTIPPAENPPPALQWDLWLGSAAARPYTSGGWDTAPQTPARPEGGFYLPFNWRGFYDFGTGSLGDWGIHTFGPANQALRLGMPTAVECVRAEKRSQLMYPERSVLRFDFPARGNMPPVSLYWYDGARDPSLPYLYRPKGMENENIVPAMENLATVGRIDLGSIRDAGGGRGGTTTASSPNAVTSGNGRNPTRGVLYGLGSVFVGDKGYLATVQRGEGVQLLPAARWADYRLPVPFLPRSPGHHRDWIRACKGGGPACSDFSVAGPFAEWVTLGAIAYRFEGKLEYDAARQRFTNHPEANQYLKPVFRKGRDLKL